MDQPTVRSVLAARTRDDLAALGPDVAALAGGSGIFAEPHPHLTGLVDLQTLGWPALVVTDAGLEIAATCTIAQVAGIPARDGWAAHPLFLRACTALFGSTEIWRVATVGGNICSALPAGPMTALAAALDAEALVWRAASDGSPAHDARMPVAEPRHGRPHDRAPAGRRAALDPRAHGIAPGAHGVPEDRAVAHRPVRLGRHRAARRGRRVHARGDGRDAPARAAAVRIPARGRGARRRRAGDRILVHRRARRRRLAPRGERAAGGGGPGRAGGRCGGIRGRPALRRARHPARRRGHDDGGARAWA
ncbi:FAD binding domain-containing protein [Clavibacter tessellarius]|uniref:FAD binding domain-containing protein n=1 Tax=Clavibacter tessellarius TaxID=31965 RepID=UPI0032456292